MVLLWGFPMNFLMIENIDAAPIIAFQADGPRTFLGLYFVSIITGTMIYGKSCNPAISFVGFNFLVLPLGIVQVATLPFFEYRSSRGPLLPRGA